jgi:hypothetical protein
MAPRPALPLLLLLLAAAAASAQVRRQHRCAWTLPFPDSPRERAHAPTLKQTGLQVALDARSEDNLDALLDDTTTIAPTTGFNRGGRGGWAPSPGAGSRCSEQQPPKHACMLQLPCRRNRVIKRQGFQGIASAPAALALGAQQGNPGGGARVRQRRPGRCESTGGGAGRRPQNAAAARCARCG